MLHREEKVGHPVYPKLETSFLLFPPSGNVPFQSYVAKGFTPVPDRLNPYPSSQYLKPKNIAPHRL